LWKGGTNVDAAELERRYYIFKSRKKRSEGVFGKKSNNGDLKEKKGPV